jgi:hypothetical protein
MCDVSFVRITDPWIESMMRVYRSMLGISLLKLCRSTTSLHLVRCVCLLMDYTNPWKMSHVIVELA